MSQSPTAARYRAALTKLRDLLITEMKPAKADGWLVLADECIIGLHAKDSSFKATGIYILPRRSKPSESESNMWQHDLGVRVIIQRRSLMTDVGQASPPTFDVTDLAAGILDLVQRNRTLDLGSGELAYIFIAEDAEPAVFEVLFLEAQGLAYRAEVNFTLQLESPTP